MDEENGRPGPSARPSGPVDVLADALTKSLRHPLSYVQHRSLNYFAILAVKKVLSIEPDFCGDGGVQFSSNSGRGKS